MSALHLLVLPDAPPERVLRALRHAPLAGNDLVAHLTRVLEANAVVLAFADAQGQAAPLALEPIAAALSQGGEVVGLAQLDAAAGTRSWQTWTGGQRVQWLTQDDELYLPPDARGRPDLDAEPRTRAQGADAGWVLLRSCLDRGMERSFSCRFAPIAHALEQGGGEHTAWVLIARGHPLAGPQPWTGRG